MKQFDFKKLSLPLVICVVFTAIIINSCRKDNKSQPLADPALNQAKTWYESAYPAAGNTRMLSPKIRDRQLTASLISANISNPTGTMQENINGWVKM